MLAQFNSFPAFFLKHCCLHAVHMNFKQIQLLAGEVSTFHGVTAEAAGGPDAVQPSAEAAGEVLAPCGQQEIHEVLPLHLESLVCVAVLILSTSLVFSAWRKLALT